MLNHVVLVGRITDIPELNTTENDKTVTTVTIAVQKPYKNLDGLYESDNIKCILWDSIATNTTQYCKKGDVVGIKGRLQVKNNKIEVIAEKVTFLSTKQG